MVFVLDTTGSMGGLIDGAKQRIWGIINEVMQKPSRPRVRVGLVAYRDLGDEYVTKITPLTEDLDSVYTNLMAYRADGGGDQPENVRKALAEGVRHAGWSASKKGLAQIVFLVGDAPPQNYIQEPDVLTTTAEAVRKNMIVNTIQCGAISGTKDTWQSIALRGEGKYFAIAQDGGVQAISTPYDAKLAELAAKIGKTYITYGSLSAQESKLSPADERRSDDNGGRARRRASRPRR
jgi:Mg-chelatase subunit ChlD